jgi:hypothetical protein
MPVTVPVVGITEATEVLLLLQLPDGVASDKFVLEDTHTVGGPEIAAGEGLTVSGVARMQPVEIVYVILMVPDEMPVMVPSVPAVATDVLLLLHVPPDVVLLSVMLAPVHTADGPVILAGSEFTVTTCVAKHPVGNA